MKKHPYIRHFFIFIIYILMWVPNFFIAPLLWMLGIVNYVRKKKTPFLVWFVNNDEPTEVENNYGDDNYRAKRGILYIDGKNVFVRFWWYCKWNVFRNSYFYFKLNVISPKRLPPKVVKVYVNTLYGENATRRENLHFCSYDDRGKIHILEKRGDTFYFRYSFTKEVTFFGRRLWNVQLGANDTEDIWGNTDNTNRYLFKSKIPLTKNVQ